MRKFIQVGFLISPKEVICILYTLYNIYFILTPVLTKKSRAAGTSSSVNTSSRPRYEHALLLPGFDGHSNS
jgi:hypothetical protein